MPNLTLKSIRERLAKLKVGKTIRIAGIQQRFLSVSKLENGAIQIIYNNIQDNNYLHTFTGPLDDAMALISKNRRKKRRKKK